MIASVPGLCILFTLVLFKFSVLSCAMCPIPIRHLG